MISVIKIFIAVYSKSELFFLSHLHITGKMDSPFYGLFYCSSSMETR